ncbi:MAG: N-acetylmuramoyl-L-alanine amidase [Elusimicrobia bacterium]|nr:N-acetylmuramoyl-L-alanine amidase [Elusimicrobiota bacterium]
MILLAILLAALPAAAYAQDASTAAVTSVSTAPVSLSTQAAAVIPEIRVIWPAEGAKYPYLKRSYTFGNVTPGSTLTVNGQPIQPRASGAFLAMVDFSTGPFELRFSAQLNGVSTEAVRAVSVSDVFEALAEKRILVLEPKEDLTLHSGDWLTVRCRGPAGAEAHFRVHDLSKDQSMEELENGLYEGRWRIPGGKEGKNRKILIQFKSKDGKLKAEAPGKLSLLEGGRYQVALSTAKTTILKSAAGGYDLFMPPGIQLAVSGSAGSSLRIALSPEDEAWVDSAQVRILPKGTPPPSGTVGKYLSTAVSSGSVRLSVQVDKNLPFEVYETIEPLAFEVRFYGAQQRIDRIRYAPGDSILREVRWKQETSQVVKLTIQTRLKWGCGYDAYYEKGRFVLEIRRPPALSGDLNVLAGRRIVLDPGHGPDRGALGPMGSQEQDINLALAFSLKKLLEKEGAEVFLTRASSAGPPLYERPGIAWSLKGDMLISIHNNALAVTDDPFESPRGFMNLYYQPHSRPLADAMHAAYGRNSPLPDEAIHWGDLHVCRTLQMPAVLTESAYVMLPAQEEMLLSESGKDLFARIMLEGARGYFEAVRNLQLESEDERRAARRE